MPDEVVDAQEPADAEAPEEVDDTVPCPACHQPVKYSYLAEKYVADVPAKFRPRQRKEA